MSQLLNNILIRLLIWQTPESSPKIIDSANTSSQVVSSPCNSSSYVGSILHMNYLLIFKARVLFIIWRKICTTERYYLLYEVRTFC